MGVLGREEIVDREAPLWALAIVIFAAVGVVALRSPLLGALLAAAAGLLVLLALVIGTLRGSLVLASLLIVVAVALPEDVSLQYRIPLAGGGIFASDLLLALLVASWLLPVFASGELRLLRSPVNLPLFLFLVWIAVETVVGYVAGHELRYVLQDLRGLAYYVLYFWVVSSVTGWRQVRALFLALGAAMLLGFAVGVLYTAMGRGEVTGFVETGVSRFPAPNEVFLIGALLIASWLVTWPGGQRRPWYLWPLLALALTGLLLSLVRGYWVGFVFGGLVLLVSLRTRQRLRLVVAAVIAALLVAGIMAVVRPAVLASVVSRAEAVTAVGDRNVQYRFQENKAVLAQIRVQPVTGYGLGKTFVPDFSRWGIPLEPKVYIHNNYFWFLQRLGLVGLALFAWAMLVFLDPRRWRWAVGGDRAWLDGLMVGSRVVVASLLLVSLTSPQFYSKGVVTVIAVLMGLAEVAARNGAADEGSEAAVTVGRGVASTGEKG